MALMATETLSQPPFPRVGRLPEIKDLARSVPGLERQKNRIRGGVAEPGGRIETPSSPLPVWKLSSRAGKYHDYGIVFAAGLWRQGDR